MKNIINKKILGKTERIIKPVTQKKVRLNEKRLNHLVEIEDIEELHYIISILNYEQIARFIQHFKKRKLLNKKESLSVMINNAKSPQELLTLLKQGSLEHLNKRYDSICHKMSEQRKSGKDLKIELLKSKLIPLKIKMYAATDNKIDFYRVKKAIDNLEAELNKLS